MKRGILNLANFALSINSMYMVIYVQISLFWLYNAPISFLFRLNLTDSDLESMFILN